MSYFRVGAVLVVILAYSPALAQKSVQAASEREVVFQLRMQHRKGQAAAIDGSKLSISVDGKRCQLLGAAPIGERPRVVAFVFDTSGSMQEAKRVRELASVLVNGLMRSGDAGMLITFSDTPTILTRLTSNREKLIAAIEGLEFKGKTETAKAVTFATAELARHGDGYSTLRTMVIVGDFQGEIATNFNKLADAAASKQISIHNLILDPPHRIVSTLVTVPGVISSNSSSVVVLLPQEVSSSEERLHSRTRLFALRTGGMAFVTKTADEFRDAVDRINQFLASTVLLRVSIPNRARMPGKLQIAGAEKEIQLGFAHWVDSPPATSQSATR